MSIPSWYPLVLLALAAFRTWRLLALDVVLDRPRRYVTRTPQNWREGQPTPAGVHFGLAEFIECPWCLGFWVTLAWWGAWEAWPHTTEIVAAPFALTAIVGAVAHGLSGE